MNRTIDTLKREIASRGLVTPSSEETFQILLNEACEQCCAGYGGGNKQCPPPPDA